MAHITYQHAGQRLWSLCFICGLIAQKTNLRRKEGQTVCTERDTGKIWIILVSFWSPATFLCLMWPLIFVEKVEGLIQRSANEL